MTMSGIEGDNRPDHVRDGPPPQGNACDGIVLIPGGNL